jgi:hypothetical protein
MTPTWKGGAASVVITPAEPMWLAGWAARHEPARSASADLFAKALALEDASGGRLVIVTADLIAIPRELAHAVAHLVRERAGLSREELLFNASHTHTGPEIRPDKVPFFEIPAEFAARIPAYVSRLTTLLADVILAALARLEPAQLIATSARASFAMNRRAAGGPSDPDVPILLALRAGPGAATREPLAILFGYACHNLTLPPTFCAFHGDYAGVAQHGLEQNFPGATALFLAGAGADQDPSPRGTLELAEQHGRSLADAVATATTPLLDSPSWGRAAPGASDLTKTPRTSPARLISPTLRLAYEELALDLQPLPAREQLESDAGQSTDLPRRRKAAFLLTALAAGQRLATSVSCPIHVVHFGDELLLIALGGEPVIDFALAFKAAFAGPLVWVAGYSNDMFGYVPTRRIQQEGGYEGGRAALWSAVPMPVADSVEQRVIGAVGRLVGG